ncbi:hypothetical protein MUN88_02250 [Gracilibacillus caseinilyticus]|uniref:Uncharacterized protein n=1 Tax=Gracilibacillus caseinilyticus TaxID=2932256 RepID=A0ABY4EYD8_9BACI|nr:hypothetical protein [Gracilibacillus caseinilyticus]UOQ48980.1 hypothetical protein MUN88_02250 [Gracilibacillus caseinilyticus]
MKNKWVKVIQIVSLLIAVGFLCLQIGSLVVHSYYEAEYIDDRLFYVFNIIIVIGVSVNLLLTFKKKVALVIVSCAVVILLSVQSYLLFQSNQHIQQITNVSPDLQEVFSVKKNLDTGTATYYRSYYGILGRPKEDLESSISETGNIEWIADDIAVFTYTDIDHNIRQFVGTYGDRQDGRSYSYVEAQIRGEWEGEQTTLSATSEGVTIVHNGTSQFFKWEQAKQYGTLAIVFSENNQAKWTIGLGEDFHYDENTPDPPIGSIILYEASMEGVLPVKLMYSGQTPLS